MPVSNEKEDLYIILELSNSADQTNIRQSYKKLAKKYHPDKLNYEDGQVYDDQSIKFERIHYAYNILRDPLKRSIYDKYGHEGLEVLDNVGEENIRLLVYLNRPIIILLLLLFGLTTFGFCGCGCCCCFCCNFCCGKYAPKDTSKSNKQYA